MFPLGKKDLSPVEAMQRLGRWLECNAPPPGEDPVAPPGAPDYEVAMACAHLASHSGGSGEGCRACCVSAAILDLHIIANHDLKLASTVEKRWSSVMKLQLPRRQPSLLQRHVENYLKDGGFTDVEIAELLGDGHGPQRAEHRVADRRRKSRVNPERLGPPPPSTMTVEIVEKSSG